MAHDFPGGNTMNLPDGRIAELKLWAGNFVTASDMRSIANGSEHALPDGGIEIDLTGGTSHRQR